MSEEANSNDVRYNLASAFDRFCLDHGIDYFAIKDTLVGAVSYGAFLPDNATFDLGILRGPFEKLRKLAGKEGTLVEDAANGSRLSLRRTCDKVIRHYLVFTGKNGEEEFEAKALLHVFDEITDDFNLTTFQRWRAELWTKAAKRVPGFLKTTCENRVDARARLYDATGCDEASDVLELWPRRYPLAHFARTRRVPFGTGTLSIPIDTSCWIESDAAAESNRVKRVQQDTLLILHEVDRICRENNIGYFLCAGSLLGCLRHGGFIPWDDDIDLGMLRDDYERFLQVAPSAIDPRFFVQNRRTDPDVEYLFTKVRLSGTEYVTDYTRYRNQEKGISIDVFPFDKAPVESAEFEAYAKEAQRLVLAHRAVARHRVTEDFPRRKARNLMEFIGHIMMDKRNKPYNSEALNKTQQEYERFVTQYNDDPSADYAVSHVAYLTYLPLKDLLPYRQAKFEDGMFPIPNNPDPLMSMQFGDYMSEPPKHQRHGHRVISWRTSDGTCG